MGTILKAEEKLLAFEKPVLRPVTTFEKTDVDTLVLCAGFEDRATVALEEILKERRPPSVILIDYRPEVPENKTTELVGICKKFGVEPHLLLYARDDRAYAGERIIEKIAEIANGRVLIDVSAMSRLLIVQIVVALSLRGTGFLNTSIAYVEAWGYPPSESEVEKALRPAEEELERAHMFICSGVYDIAIVPELSSVALQSHPIRSSFFPSFNPYQLAAILHEVQPNYFTIIHGVPPLAENAWRTDAIKRLNKTDDIPAREEFQTSTLIYSETLDILLSTYKRFADFERLVVSPTGSKMQSLSVGLFRAFFPDVQVAYPTPLKYDKPTAVTVGLRQRYILELDAFQNALSL